MKAYLDLLRTVLTEGRHRGDRTGTGTTSIFDYKFVHDMRTGYPLVTTKKVFARGMFKELRAILRGELHLESLIDEGVKIWCPWRITAEQAVFRYGDPGRKLVSVTPVIKENTGYYNPVSDLRGASNGSVDDLLRKTWSSMMSRCYDQKHKNFAYYGARGVFVDPRWHVLSQFIEDVKKLPNWHNKLHDWNNFDLDKDYYSSNCYSPETCLWLESIENSMYSCSSTIIAITPTGDASIHVSLAECAKAIGMSKSSLHRTVNGVSGKPKGNNKQFIGWKFIAIDVPFRYSILKEGDLNAPYGSGWRNWVSPTNYNVSDLSESDPEYLTKLIERFTKPKTIDQFAYAMDLLRNNPESRRILVSAWNPGWMPEETRQVELSFTERYALFEKMYSEKHEHCEELLSYPEYAGDIDAAIHEMNEAKVPTHKTVKVEPQENVINGKPCLTPCHWAFEFYVEDLTVNERLDWLMHHNAEARATFQKRLDSGELCYEEYIHAALDTVGGMFDQVGVPRQYLSLKWHQRKHNCAFLA